MEAARPGGLKAWRLGGLELEAWRLEGAKVKKKFEGLEAWPGRVENLEGLRACRLELGCLEAWRPWKLGSLVPWRLGFWGF